VENVPLPVTGRMGDGGKKVDDKTRNSNIGRMFKKIDFAENL